MPRPLSEEARTKAIDAATSLLAEEGIDGFSVDAVARRSGVAKSTLYRHWESANDLLVNALDCHVEQIPTPDTGSLHGDLETLFETIGAVVKPEDNRHLLLDTLAAGARDPDLARVEQAMFHERMRPIREIVERAIDRGEIPPIDTELAALFVHGPVMARILLVPEPIRAQDIVELVPLLVRGLGGQPNGPNP